MRISDWSSDVCSSDLDLGIQPGQTDLYLGHFLGTSGASRFLGARQDNPAQNAAALLPEAAAANRGVFYDADGRARSVGADRTSVVWGKSVAVRVDLGGRRIIKKTNKKT